MRLAPALGGALEGKLELLVAVWFHLGPIRVRFDLGPLWVRFGSDPIRVRFDLGLI